jgi:transposase
MVRQRQGVRFDDWRHSVRAAEIPEIQSFANSLEQDRDALIAGLTLEWSNGPTEGHVNRLKAIKRQMYGRSGLKMLRARVLAPP